MIPITIPAFYIIAPQTGGRDTVCITGVEEPRWQGDRRIYVATRAFAGGHGVIGVRIREDEILREITNTERIEALRKIWRNAEEFGKS